MGFIFLMFVSSAQAQEELNEGGGILSDENGQLSLSSLFQTTTTDKLMKKETNNFKNGETVKRKTMNVIKNFCYGWPLKVKSDV
jgi:hypothetical protein